MANTKIPSELIADNSVGIDALNVSDGTNGQVLTTDGSGTLSFSTISSGATDINGLSDAKTFGTGSIMLGDTTTGTLSNANYNVGVGVDMLNSLTSGYANIAIGFESCKDLTTGHNNVAVGHTTLYENIGGEQNVAVGSNALQNNTSGSYSVAIGKSALAANTTASNNTAVGYNSLTANNTGSSNTAMGRGAMFYNTTGNQNTAIGQEALANNTTAANNTAVGYGALVTNTTGYRNTCIGASAGDNITTGYGHTMVGYAVDPAYASGSSGELGFGREMITNGSGYFTVGVGTNKGYYNYGSTNGFTAGSDERLKEEIENSTVGLSFINDLTLRTFKWRKKKNIDPALEAYVPEGEEGAEERHLNKEETQLGMIAQEVKAVIDNHPEIPAGFAGHMVDVKGTECLDYVPFIQPLLKAVQELSAKNDALEARLTALES